MKIAAKAVRAGILSLSLLSIITGCKTSSPEKSGADLFNGKDFSGWTFCMKSNSAPEKTWSVANGLIHCTGQPSGYARTEQIYGDYRLTVVWRFVKVAPHADNTGILVQMQLPDKVWPECVECQGQYQRQGDFWLLSGVNANDHPADSKKAVRVPQIGPTNENPAGEWNTNQIVCRGNIIELAVNGRKMNQLAGCNLSSGFIGIQSEGGEIEVRKLFLEPLN